MWLTSNHIFGSGDFWDKSPSWFLKNLKLPSPYSGNFKIFKNALGQFIPNCPTKHVITSTIFLAIINHDNLLESDLLPKVSIYSSVVHWNFAWSDLREREKIQWIQCNVLGSFLVICEEFHQIFWKQKSEPNYFQGTLTYFKGVEIRLIFSLK